MAFLEDRIEEIPAALEHLGIDAPRLGTVKDSMFDSFAGIFHAFHALEHSVLDALKNGRDKEAEYRLLGRKYDSLPSLLERVMKEDEGDPVIRYVTVLCARQLVRQVERDAAEFQQAHRDRFRALRSQLTKAERVRDRLSFGTPEERAAFLDWFEPWFLARAKPIEVSA